MFSKVVLALAILAGSASAGMYTSSPEAQKYMWEQFKAEHSRTYATQEEEVTRFGNFIEFLKTVDRRNSAEKGSAVHGITKFADLSADEFKAQFTNLKYVRPATRDVDETIEPLPQGVQALKDWTGVYTTPVKDQGYCGSCWAFSVTEQLESDYMRATGKEAILSAQQVTSCTKYFIAGGCDGGSTEKGFEYTYDGLELDSDYPYVSGTTEQTGTCKTSSALYVVKSTGYKNVASSATQESAMASYVQATGPLSIVVDAEEWSSYTGGVLTTCGTTLDHAVQAVGIDTANGYWKVRNSWGTSWGESGFIRLAYGKNTCGLASDANYVVGAQDF